MSDPAFPIINLNGSSGADLVEYYLKAHNAVDAAIEHCNETKRN